MSFIGIMPSVVVDTKMLEANLPYLYATFQDRRRIIRSSLDPIRDIFYNTVQGEVVIALQLNGATHDADEITGIDLNYESVDGLTSGQITLDSNPEAFDLTRRMVIRGESVNVLVIKMTPALLSQFFSIGLWNIELFLYDFDNTNGALWGELEWEVRSIYTPRFITVPTGSMSFVTYAPTVIYRFMMPDTASLDLTAYVPDISRQNANRPGTASLALASEAPILVNRLAGITGSMSLSGAAPIRS
jgi:hypothetical protein